MKIIHAGAFASALLLSAGAHASNLISNGDFETGAFSPWIETDQAGGSGSFFVQPYGQGTPINGFGTPTQATGGTYFASTDQTGPGSHTIAQSFNATPGGTFTLSFDAYGSDLSGAAPTGVGPDYNTSPNQHFEVDLNGMQVYYGAPVNAWNTYTFDVSSDIVAGLNTLSFNEVDNQSFYNVGVDNVSLSGGVPEPAAWALMLTGMGLIGGAVRRRSASAVSA